MVKPRDPQPGDPKRPLFPEVKFPSDRLTLGQLRAHWLDPEDLMAIVGEISFLEYRVAHNAYLVARDEWFDYRTDPLFKPEYDADVRRLGEFYVALGLAPGQHAAELMIADIAAQVEKLDLRQSRG